MSLIEIPLKVVLDAVLAELHLPKSTSNVTIQSDHAITVTVTICPSAGAVYNISDQKSFTSQPRTTVKAAENQAVIQALEYMECFQDKVVNDYSYPWLKKARTRVECLLNHVDDKDREIKRLRNRLSRAYESHENLMQQLEEKKAQIKRLSKGWDTFINQICGPAERIHQAVQANQFDGTTELEHVFISVLTEVDRAASELQSLTIRASDKVQIVGTYPYDLGTGSSEENQHTKEGTKDTAADESYEGSAIN